MLTKKERSRDRRERNLADKEGKITRSETTSNPPSATTRNPVRHRRTGFFILM
ncbi:MAG: hypothetical protein R6V34_00525 [Bacteroidales bacterium]